MLDKYHAKRDFRRTPEPEGAKADSSEARFVVQEHHASRLHYDFRLEMDGVLRSWAVPKEPPTSPGTRRLAVQVEDHPVDYIGFEGTIPEGQYGAGTVRIWDKGGYTMEKSGDDTLTFVLRGSKLNGRFALVRLKSSAKDWLFLKLKEG